MLKSIPRAVPVAIQVLIERLLGNALGAAVTGRIGVEAAVDGVALREKGGNPAGVGAYARVDTQRLPG